MHARAGQVAKPQDLVNVDALLSAYYDIEPDSDNPAQRVSFGTSGHRGTSANGTFNEAHIVSTTAAIVEYRRLNGYDGALFVGADPHALSEPAWRSAIEVLEAAGVHTMIDSRRSWTPTPAVSLAILNANTVEGKVRLDGPGLADGIIITPSHNPPEDGGFKYNPPTGGPADARATTWIANRANEIMRNGWQSVPRSGTSEPSQLANVHFYDYLANYVTQLSDVIDFDPIRDSGLRIAADPLGGAAVDYWGAIAERYGLDLTVVNPHIDPQFGFMTLDWDGKIRMDCSSPYAMASLVEQMKGGAFDIATGNDTDSDRHGIVTPDGLVNPNHFLAVAIEYLFQNRPHWPADAAIGKTIVSSSLIDRVVASIDRQVYEVPVGFKYFVDGLLDASLGFGGEESAGASFLRRDGSVWTTDKDGIIMALLASEMTAVTGKNPSELHREQTEKFGQSWYARIDQAATKEEKAVLADLSPADVTAKTLAGQPITDKLVRAPGDDAPLGGLKVTTADSWFAARPSGTEDVYKIYAESFVSEDHLKEVQEAAKGVVGDAFKRS